MTRERSCVSAVGPSVCGVAWCAWRGATSLIPVPEWLVFKSEIPWVFYLEVGCSLILSDTQHHLVCSVLEERENFGVLWCACGWRTAGSVIKALLLLRFLGIGKSLSLLGGGPPLFFLYTRLY